jgi:fluoride ion exporter CrcB/FEX
MLGPDRRELAAVFTGGARGGTLARAAIASLVPVEAARWPWPTFAVNVVGAFLLGYFTGSYTTFSTWTLETHRSARNPSGGSPPSTSSPASCL